MDKSSYQLAVHPVASVRAVSAVANIGSAVQSLESRATHLANQHAALMAQISATASGLQTVQKLVSSADVSATAQWINQSLQQAEAAGFTGQYRAQTILTKTPTVPNVVTQQLKTAINQSGLFYESHLHDLAEGHRTVAELKQEPQNKPHHIVQSLLPQQLHVLEHQRVSWHGEVWPGQQMDWDLYVRNGQESKDNKNDHDHDNDQATVASDLTLHLPHLGKVTAKIRLNNGRMQIALLAQQEKALRVLIEKSPALVNRIENNGQKIDSLTLNGRHHTTNVAR
jgi:flagellar hook-length control protein FliK